MKLIVGLGNPGTKYSRTRHNAGFIVLDELAKGLKAKFKPHKAMQVELAQSGEFLLAKPQTFMNNSGRAVSKLVKAHSLKPKDVVVIYDDVDLEFGKIRARATGTSAGHKGMQSVIEHLGTKDIPRIKIGVGRDPKKATDEHVLSAFTATEFKAVQGLTDEVKNLLES